MILLLILLLFLPRSVNAMAAGTYGELNVTEDNVFIKAEGKVIINGSIKVDGRKNVKIEGIIVQNSKLDGVLVTNSENITLSNLEVNNSGDAAIKVVSSKNIVVEKSVTKESVSSGIGIWRSENVMVEGNKVINARNVDVPRGHEECITIAITSNFEVKNNEVYFENMENYEGAAGIDVKESSSNGTVHNNYIHDLVNDVGIYVDAWKAGLNGTATLKNVNVYNNRVERAGGISVGAESGGTVENINIYNNIITKSRWSGIVLTATSLNGWRKNINIFNNTIYESTGNGGAGIYIVTKNIANILVKNNIVSFGPKWAGQITVAEASVASQVAVSHNLVAADTKKCADNFPNCVEMTANNIVGDPGFGNAFNLLNTSKAIGQGEKIDLANRDFDGKNRGEIFDIGALEYMVTKNDFESWKAAYLAGKSTKDKFEIWKAAYLLN